MTDIPAPTPAVAAWLNAHSRRYASGESYFVDDQDRVILDPTRDGLPNADARGAAAWLNRIHPELWGETKPVTETATTTSTPSTASDLMQAVRSGSMSSDEATRQILAARPVENRPAPDFPAAPTYDGNSMSALMARVRAGDASALADLTKRYLDPRK